MNDSTLSLYPTAAPVGAVIAYAGNAAPYTSGSAPATNTIQPENFGWMLCDGSQLNMYEYPELYAALGRLYTPAGVEDDFFCIPDLRGQFLRGVGSDNASTENRMDALKNASTGVGSVQQSALQTHQHQYGEAKGSAPAEEGSPAFAVLNPDALTGFPNLDKVNLSHLETRPVNVFIHYLIKYTYALPKYNGPGLPF